MSVIFIEFIIGLLSPFISGRFGKILPTDPGHVLLWMWHRPRFPKVRDVNRSRQLYQKWTKLIYISITWGIVFGGLFYISHIFLPNNLSLWAYIFLTIIAFCIQIDSLYCLLPDFFTIPMLIIGFLFAVEENVISPLNSIIGSAFGYLIATLSVVLLGRNKQAEMGFGDVKMMAALGAWLGATGLNYTLVLSFFLFAIQVTLSKKRQGPYGPALGIAGVISFFLIYMN